MNDKLTEFVIAVVNNNLNAFFAENKLLFLFIMLFLLSILFIEITVIYYLLMLIFQALNY